MEVITNEQKGELPRIHRSSVIGDEFYTLAAERLRQRGAIEIIEDVPRREYDQNLR